MRAMQIIEWGKPLEARDYPDHEPEGEEVLLRVEAAGVYIYVHAGTKRHLYRSSVTQLLQRLDPQRFVRIHRSAAVNTSRIIFRAYRDYKPMRFFGKMALWLMTPGLMLELFFFGHYLLKGKFTPHLWAGFSGAALFGLGLMALHMGLIGDMMSRQRVYLEELLYRQRESAWRESSAVATTLPPAPVESQAVEVHPAHSPASEAVGAASAADTSFPGPAGAPPSRSPGQVASPVH